ncbi:MAG: aspartyl protease family protein [Spirosomataceae bacterium]
MKMTVFLLLLSLRGYSQSLSDTLTFSLNKQNNICLKARINHSDTLTLMFHTASTGITLLNETVTKKLPLRLDKSNTVQTWGGTAESRYSQGNTMTMSGLKWENMTIYTNENSGEGTDGKFGQDLFAGKIVEINYDIKQLIVHKNLPPNINNYAKSGLKIIQGSIYIEAALGTGEEVYKDDFMFHTGYGGSILLDPKIGEKYKMQARLHTVSTSELRDSYNNVIKIETKLLPELTVGGETLHNVPVSFAAQSSEIPMKVMGNDLLKRFNVIFDFRKNEIYLKVNQLRGMPFAVKK